ncbi:hypothetical protein L5515_001737 [Caenorhabditis briggsae]|nr:hypothetical protein L3Y34_015660 [Caenorhabditis briggsae]UMM13496.1 hypothetical protein L5515_001737 [Caenorhabditis briggsae]
MKSLKGSKEKGKPLKLKASQEKTAINISSPANSKETTKGKPKKPSSTDVKPLKSSPTNTAKGGSKEPLTPTKNLKRPSAETTPISKSSPNSPVGSKETAAKKKTA